MPHKSLPFPPFANHVFIPYSLLSSALRTQFYLRQVPVTGSMYCDDSVELYRYYYSASTLLMHGCIAVTLFTMSALLVHGVPVVNILDVSTTVLTLAQIKT